MIIAVFAALFVGWNWLFIRRSSSVLRERAAKHDYEILRSEISFGAPFRAAALSFWSTSRGRLDYSVTLRNRAGEKRSAEVSCCGFVRGVFSNDEVKVPWGDETAA